MSTREGGYEFLASRVDLREGGTLSARHDGLDVLLCRHGEKIYAFENRCPHQGKPMDGARIRNGQLVCPHHGARFDLQNGRGSGGAAQGCLRVLHVRLTATDIEIGHPPPPA